MAKILFWNVKRLPLHEHVAGLCSEHAVDVAILAESEMEDIRLLNALNGATPSRYHALPRSSLARLKFYTSYDERFWLSAIEARHVAIRRIQLPVGVDFLIAAVHMPAKPHWADSDLSSYAQDIAREVRESEKNAGHSRTVLVGDFNMDPFQDGIVGGLALHGVMDRRIAQRGTRIIAGQQSQYFYNPMWSMMGDMSDGPPGTYYYRRGGRPTCQFWHTFDQALVRPALLGCLPKPGVQVLTHVGGTDLLDANGVPDTTTGSDHLPILVTLHTETMETRSESCQCQTCGV